MCRTKEDQAAIQGLHTLFDRSNFEAPEFQALVLPMYQSENVRLLRHLYEWSVVGVQNIDSSKYAISKKFSEVSSSNTVDRFQP
jgi:exportin-5